MLGGGNFPIFPIPPTIEMGGLLRGEFMKITIGQVFVMAGSLLVSGGLLVPSETQKTFELSEIFALVVLWAFSLSALAFHDKIFKKDMVLLTVIPILALGFLWLLLNLSSFLLLAPGRFNTYAILFGWVIFNTGLYLDTKKALKESSKG